MRCYVECKILKTKLLRKRKVSVLVEFPVAQTNVHDVECTLFGVRNKTTEVEYTEYSLKADFHWEYFCSRMKNSQWKSAFNRIDNATRVHV